MGKIITFGEIMLRLSPNGYDRLFQNDCMKAVFGGAEANVAASLAQYGEEAVFVSKVPKHRIGEGAVAAARSVGVDTSFIVRGGERLGIYFYEKGAANRSSECIYDRSGSAIQEASVDDFDWERIFTGADWFHFTGITLALGGNLVRILEDACKAAKRSGVRVSCDLNYRSRLWSREEAREVMSELCRYADVCIGNEEDARNVFGIEIEKAEIGKGFSEASVYEETAKKLVERFGFDAVAFSLRTSYSATCNDWEGMLYDRERFYYSERYHIDHIVDRVGSGDSFAAGIIYGMHNQWDGRRTLDFAVASGALKHTIEGDFNRVTFDEVVALMNGSGNCELPR